MILQVLEKNKFWTQFFARRPGSYNSTSRVATEGAATASSAVTLCGLEPFDVTVTFDGG
jgi:hypothetical protein